MIIDPINGKDVAFVGLGVSANHYLGITEAAGDRKKFCDETWTINTYGNVIQHDRLFFMDDVRLIMRETDNPKMVNALEMLKRHPGPVYTSRPHPDFPALVPYPLEAVINEAGYDYLNNGAAQAIAFAIACKPHRLYLFGVDFLPMDGHDAPAGRECCEYWIGRAQQRGIQVVIAQRSSLLGTNLGRDFARPIYGYDTATPVRKLVLRNDEPYVEVSMRDRPESEWPPVPPPPGEAPAA